MEHTKRRAKCCCAEHSKELSKRNHIRNPIVVKICPKCGIEHTKNGKFCSRRCANSHTISKELKKKISCGVTKFFDSVKPNRISKHGYQHVCKNCKTSFLGTKNQKFCSRECARIANKEISLSALKKGIETLRKSGNLGGYRPGSGRAKHGYYKGIYCGSTYELVWLIYQLDHGNPVERFPGELEWNGIKYVPDFLQNGRIVELKGYEKQESVDKKTAVANHFGYDVLVLREKDLKLEFDWVKSHYQYHDLEELYDTYKPKFTYTCAFCGNEFTRNKQLKSAVVCCSRKCAGRLVSKRFHASLE